MTGFAIDAVALSAAMDALSSDGNAAPLSAIFNQYAFDEQGGAGNDVLPGFMSRRPVSTAVAGSIAVDYWHYGAGITASLADPSINTGNAAGDTYTNITTLIGTNYGDVLYGDTNNNALEGGAGADALHGGGGFDYASYIHAQSGVVADLGNPLNNTGNDDATGDTYYQINGLIGSNYNDKLTGDANDNFLRGRSGADILDGGAGSDTADYWHGGPVRADLSNPANNLGDAFGDIYISIENLRGSDFNDALKGDAGDNKLTGMAGADVFIYSGGHDIVADFSQAQGDLIALGGSGVTDWSQLQPLINANGGNAQIVFGSGDTITLNGVNSASLTAADFVFDSTANDKGTVAEEGAQVVSGQLTPNGATSWDIVGGQRVLPTDFGFAIDEFSVNKDGTIIFDDTFGATAPPDGPNFLTGTTPSPIYHTTGGFADFTDGNNNQVAQISSDSAAFSGLRNPSYIFGDLPRSTPIPARLLQNDSNGLKSGQPSMLAAFSISFSRFRRIVRHPAVDRPPRRRNPAPKLSNWRSLTAYARHRGSAAPRN